MIKRTTLVILTLGLWLPVTGYADPPPAGPAPADQNSAALDDVSQFLQGQSFLLGFSYDQGTFDITTPNATGTTTDNGHATPALIYISPEHILGTMPMHYGNAVLGINFSSAFKRFRTDYTVAELSNTTRGQNLGGSLSGDYLAGDPFIYLRLSSLYPGSDNYWLFGYGLGAALMHYSGTPYLNFLTTAPDGSVQGLVPVSSPYEFYWLQEARWQFHFGNWDIMAIGRIISPYRTYQGQSATYKEFGVGISYNLHF